MAQNAAWCFLFVVPFYIVMEFLDGETLAQRLARYPRGLGTEAFVICRQIAQAMAAAHQKEVIHRDLKPDNAMLVHDAEWADRHRVKVLDFGIAKLSQQSSGKVRTETGAMMGTLREFLRPRRRLLLQSHKLPISLEAQT